MSELQQAVDDLALALEEWKQHRFDPKHYEGGKPFSMELLFEEVEESNRMWKRLTDAIARLTGLQTPNMKKCHYCANRAVKTLVWLKDRSRQPARICLPWCGCDLQVALKRFWPNPYTVVCGTDYEVLNEVPK